MAQEHLEILEDMDESETSESSGIPESPLHSPTVEYSSTGSHRLAVLIRDEKNWLFKVRKLRENKFIILLTPVVHSICQGIADAIDPFENLERSLSNRHQWVSRVPYTLRDGLTSSHINFVQRGYVTVICFVLKKGENIPKQLIETLFKVGETNPVIIVVCCKPLDLERDLLFPTVIQTFGYSPAAHEATAALIFGENPSGSSIELFLNVPLDTNVPRVWLVEPWNESRDMPSIMVLWRQCFSKKFSIEPQTLSALLNRPGYAKHYVVRHSNSGEVLGFCATYTTPADHKGEKYIASLALILVRSLHREEGIGLTLHNHAIEELKKVQGVVRIQLGSLFPRIIYGPLHETPFHDEWFLHRGWQLHNNQPGQGRAVYDLVLDFLEWKYVPPVISCSFQYQRSTQENKMQILDFLGRSSFTRYTKMGWYDQYLKQLNGPNTDDILIAIEGQVVIAAALTYSSKCESELNYNLPWAKTIGSDVGGVTCICLPTDRVATTRTELRDGLLDLSVKKLKSQGMKKLFLDGATEDISELEKYGFKEWAHYREVWMDLVNIN